MKKKLSIKFCGKTFSSPLILPSGIFTTLNDYLNAEKSGAAAVVTKSYTYFPRQGNPAPTIVRFSSGFLNSVGLKNVGIVEAKKEIEMLRKNLKIWVIVSIFDTNIKNFIQLALHLLPLKLEFLELNLSCPNVEDEYGKPLATEAESAYQVVKKMRKILGEKIKIIAKLSPNVGDIGKIALAVEDAGASAISAINTVGPGMVIDIKKKRPVLGAKKGGVSGPAIKPIAIRCVYEIYKKVNIPIIGMGGVTSFEDAVEMMLAGATLVGVGSAVYLKGWSVYQEILNGLENFLKEEKIKKIERLTGLAHFC